MPGIIRTVLVFSCLTTSLFASTNELEEIIVTADASVLNNRANIGSNTAIDEDTIELTRANHVHEALVRVPGVWVSRGSGHEHLTSIRSGILAGPGACGAFLFLENGIPVRPAGFCNVNNLFEVNTEQASSIEVMRGPASALYGGNALHGVINSVSLNQFDGRTLSVEAGPHGYSQVRTRIGGESFQLAANGTQSDGYRANTGYGQQKLNASWSTNSGKWDAVHVISLTNLNQETGGYVKGYRAYEDSDLRKTNPNPEAYRDAWSFRGSSHWRQNSENGELNLTPYIRRSGMAFFQHFLPGQPLERNEQTRAGLIAKILRSNDNLEWAAGVHIEWLDGALSQRQSLPTSGSAYLVATRPMGTHYDFELDSFMAAVFYDATISLSDTVNLIGSVRLERLGYDYDNLHLNGNTKDDGSNCGFGGCLYTRPADRDDDFTDVAGRIGLNFNLSESTTAYVVGGVGFRPPQATELYRLQSGQSIANLDSEELNSFEIGIKGVRQKVSYDLALYAENTENLIFRDSEGFNVSAGKTKSKGGEFDVKWNLTESQILSITGSYAKHEYDFTRDASRGEKIVSGNEVDTAPQWLGSVHWLSQYQNLKSEIELSHIGSHAINAANTASYGGHTLLNWRGNYSINERLEIFSRLLNILDKDYADRADYAFGSYRYFPGLPRQFHVGFELLFD